MPACRYRLLRGTVGRFIDRSAPVRRLGITLKHRVEGGRCPFALGTPAILGAHNSDTLMQQPDHQSLVREYIPTRITEALSVDAFRGSPSSGIGE